MVLKTQLPKLSVVAIFPEPLAEVISSVVSIQAVALRIKGLSAEIPLQMPWSTLSNLSAKQSSQRCVAHPCAASSAGVPATAGSQTGRGVRTLRFPSRARVLSSWVSFLLILAEWERGGGDGRAHEWLSAGAVTIVQGRKTEGKNPRGRILFSFQSSDFFFLYVLFNSTSKF